MDAVGTRVIIGSPAAARHTLLRQARGSHSCANTPLEQRRCGPASPPKRALAAASAGRVSRLRVRGGGGMVASGEETSTRAHQRAGYPPPLLWKRGG